MPGKTSHSKPHPIQVEIFGQCYAMRGGQDPQRVLQIAGFVDEQMREIARSGGAVDSVRIAVLAAMNIADELFRARASSREAEERAERQAAEKAAVLARTLGDALDG